MNLCQVYTIFSLFLRQVCTVSPRWCVKSRLPSPCFGVESVLSCLRCCVKPTVSIFHCCVKTTLSSLHWCVKFTLSLFICQVYIVFSLLLCLVYTVFCLLSLWNFRTVYTKLSTDLTQKQGEDKCRLDIWTKESVELTQQQREDSVDFRNALQVMQWWSWKTRDVWIKEWFMATFLEDLQNKEISFLIDSTTSPTVNFATPT